MPALSPLMTVIQRAVEKAIPNLMRDFGELESLQISEKSPNDFVTAADKRAEKNIFLSLAKDRPEWGFLMEESGEKKSETHPDSGKRFIIDPIDGTHNFMRGIPEWCISVAAEEDGEITAGYIFDPLRQETFWAEKGKGAFFNHKRMRVSGKKELEKAAVAFWYGNSAIYNKTDAPIHNVEVALRKRVAATREIGSSCLELAWVAAGRLDGYIHNHSQPWDYAAAKLIIEEAGGMFTDWKGEKTIYSGNGIAGNFDIHRELLKIAQGENHVVQRTA